LVVLGGCRSPRGFHRGDSTVVEGALTMAGSSIDLTAIQASAAISGGGYLARGAGCAKSSMHSVRRNGGTPLATITTSRYSG
jgi:hypothetical protein